MPYLITTRTTDTAERHDPSRLSISQTVAATLDEARKAASEMLWRQGAEPDSWRLAELSDSGGTIGPLPDGTTIEVLPVCWNWVIGVADDAGLDTDAIYDDGGDLAILAAYNETLQT